VLVDVREPSELAARCACALEPCRGAGQRSAAGRAVPGRPCCCTRCAVPRCSSKGGRQPACERHSSQPLLLCGRCRGSAPGAINIPLPQMRKRMGELPEGKKVYIYCQVIQ
jgi:rhodanese-related sulfurtransferase